MGIEKRKYKRVKLNLKVAVSNTAGRYYSQDSHAKIVNLSEGGICFESGIEFKKQEKCYLVFTLHNQRSALKVIGDILWRQKNPYLSTYGLEFSNLSFLDKMVLKRFVRLYFGEETIMDKSLFFWEITFLVLLMYLLSKACVLLPLGFTLIIMVIVTLSFYFWLLIEEKKR